MFSGRKKPLLVPDPGQKVELVTEDGATRNGFRAISGPLTSKTGEAVVRVATEEEYREAAFEGRRPVGLTWTVARLEIPIPRRLRRKHLVQRIDWQSVATGTRRYRNSASRRAYLLTVKRQTLLAANGLPARSLAPVVTMAV